MGKVQKAESFDSHLSDNDYHYLQALDEEYLNDYDPNDETKQFTEQDYANLQHNLVLFKEGNREATEYIIAAFHRTLHSYAHFIVLHQVPVIKIATNGKPRYILNSSILSFVKLFASNPKFKNKNKDGSISYKETYEYIYNLFSKFEYGDIYNELVLALLNMANKYKIITDPNDPKYHPNGSFHVYVKKCFHFEAFTFLKRLVNDPIMNLNLSSLSISNIDTYNEVMQKSELVIDQKKLNDYNMMIDYVDREIRLRDSNKLVLKEDDVDIYDEDSLNFNWINGIVCQPVFETLTPYERELLILSYLKNQTDDMLAMLFGYSRQAIGVHRRNAVKKLKENIENQGGIL